jgi:hypothetical protein
VRIVVFLVFVSYGAAVGGFTGGDDVGLRIVMGGLGAIVGAAIGGALTSLGSEPLKKHEFRGTGVKGRDLTARTTGVTTDALQSSERSYLRLSTSRTARFVSAAVSEASWTTCLPDCSISDRFVDTVPSGAAVTSFFSSNACLDSAARPLISSPLRETSRRSEV